MQRQIAERNEQDDTRISMIREMGTGQVISLYMNVRVVQNQTRMTEMVRRSRHAWQQNTFPV